MKEMRQDMDIQAEIRNELIRLDVPLTSLGGFQFDQSQEANVIRVTTKG
jgi:hypothetical protein